jgi:hypothetical protein
VGGTEAVVVGGILLISVESCQASTLHELGLSRICAKVYLDVFGGFTSFILGYLTAV